MNKLNFGDNLDILKELKKEHPDLSHFGESRQTASLSFSVRHMKFIL